MSNCLTIKIKHLDNIISELLQYIPDVVADNYDDDMNLVDVMIGKMEEIEDLKTIICLSLKGHVF